MEHDDEVGEENSTGPIEAAPGPRRSTFTPPTAPQPFPLQEPGSTDDDALADALAADLERIASGPITIITPETVVPPGPAAAAVVPPPASVPAPRPEPSPAPVSWQPPIEAGPGEPEPAPAETPTPDARPLDAEPQAYTPSAYSAPAWSGFPAPDPAQAVPLPDRPPVRKSLPDEELSRWVAEASNEPGGTLEVIEQLQNQMKLREEEAREFRAWEDRMRSLGTPEALGAVDEARPQFSGVLPEVPAAPVTGSFMLPENPVADWPAPDFAEATPVESSTPAPAESSAVPAPAADPFAAWAPPSERAPASEPAEPAPGPAEPLDQTPPEPAAFAPEPAPEPEPEPEPAAPAQERPLPAWDVPAPSPSWSPPPEWEAAAEAPAETGPVPLIEPLTGADALAHAPAPAAGTRAPFDWSPTGPVDVPRIVPVNAPVAPIQPAPEAAAPDGTPAAPDDAAPDDTADDAVVVPVLEPETDDEPAAEPDAQPELTVEPLPDTGPTPASPPPLIEPSGFGGPPLLPSQTKSSAAFSFDAALAGPPASEDDDDPEPGARAFDWTSPGPPAQPAAPTLDSVLAEEPPLHPDPEPATGAPEALFIEPMPVAAGEPVPTDTGSITVVDQAYEEELDDDVDETDRAFESILGPVSVDTAGIAALNGSISPPSGPISTVRIREDEQVLFDDEPVRQPVFSIEDSDLEPTPVDHRVGRAARLFWLWFAANSSILSLGLGAAVFAVGMSLRQSIVGILAGVALSFIPLGLTTLAGKRSGQPTMVVSRASFGLIGNVVPAVVALITRLFWGAVLLWLLGSSVAVVIVGARLDGSLGERGILLVSLAGAFLVAVLVAFAGYPMVARIQLVLSIISGILVVGLIVMTYQYIDIPQALTAPDGPWLLSVTGAVLVFSFVGLVWANSGADLARYQRTDSSGASSMLWATFGTAVPSFLLIGYGALLAASDKGIASGFLLSPLDTLALMLPSWYPVPLIAATALSLLSGIILSLYSGGFALQSIGVRVKRQWSIVIVAVLLGALALVLGFGVSGGINELFRDAATTLAVPTAAWAGIFAAETMIRNRRFEGQSLVRRGGVYADVRWVNLIGLILITAIGYGLTTATISWLGWQGYGFPLLGVPLDSDLAGTDLGVLVALLLGLLLPIVAGIPAIRKQESLRAPD
jgi:purine-cytosine permease-like protein